MTSASELLSRPRLRRATADDMLWYFELANDAAVRRNSFTQRRITLEEHRSWFGQKLGCVDVLMLVLEIDDQPIGQIRFDIDGDVALIGFGVASYARGKGFGAYLLRDGIQHLHQVYPAVRIARGLVRPENVASRRAFETSGFQEANVIPSDAVSDNRQTVVYEIDISDNSLSIESA